MFQVDASLRGGGPRPGGRSSLPVIPAVLAPRGHAIFLSRPSARATSPRPPLRAPSTLPLVSDLDLLVVGDVNPDLVLSGGDLEPRYGQAKVAIPRADHVVGGSAAIVATGAARLGVRVGVCGVVGDDPAGRLVSDELRTAGVSTSYLRVDPSLPTGISVIFVRSDDRAILTSSGSISALGPDGLGRLPDRPARHVHSSGYYLMNEAFTSALPEAFARFRAAGATTSIDTGWDPDDEWALDGVFAHLDLFLPNRAELRAATRRGSITDAMAVVREQGVDVAVKLGRKGGAAVVDGEPIRVGAPEPESFADAVGAGDSFNAGYLAAMLSGASVAHALRLAVAAGTLSTRRSGGTAGQATRDEAEALAATL